MKSEDAWGKIKRIKTEDIKYFLSYYFEEYVKKTVIEYCNKSHSKLEEYCYLF